MDATEAEIDALEYVVVAGRIACMDDYGILRSWLVRLRPSFESTPDTHATPGEGTEHGACTLTDAEREAIEYYIGTGGPDAVDATLRGLLERTKGQP